jgi:hypothetical protein
VFYGKVVRASLNNMIFLFIFVTTNKGTIDIKKCKLEQCLFIQGDSGGICNTLGNDSMCDSKQKRSYEHGSDFERLPRYG